MLALGLPQERGKEYKARRAEMIKNHLEFRLLIKLFFRKRDISFVIFVLWLIFASASEPLLYYV
ncbi:MAG: hypothetical protein ACPLSY_13400 [Moorellaceae bacterium]